MVARHNRFSGILYEGGGRYHIHSLTDGASVPLSPVMDRVVGEEVQLRIHAEPEGCRWLPGPCPAGHHELPSLSLPFEKQGELLAVEGGWTVNGVRVPLHLFEGHECDFEVYPSLKDIGARAARLQEALRKIRDM
jgi:hypothetical protein